MLNAKTVLPNECYLGRLTEGPNHKLDDAAGFKDKDFDRYATEMLKSIAGILIGRKTYELFVGYWPTATGVGG